MKYTFFLNALVCSSLLSACETSDPTQAVFDNRYPAADAGPAGGMTIYKGWWSAAQLPEPVSPGAESDPVRVVKGSDYAYALLAPDWAPESGTPPPTLLAVRTTAKLSVNRGDTLDIVISDATILGNCAGGKALSQEDADFITHRIFPGEFAGLSYVAATCVTSPSAGSAAGAAGESETGVGGEGGSVTGAGGEAGML
ncbi:MAG: hypothetical protein ABI548_27765 [Polyangiaceae bacterium]